MNESDAELARLHLQLKDLRAEHRDLDAAIDQLDDGSAEDTLLVRRMKKRRLALKDRISAIARIVEPGDLA